MARPGTRRYGVDLLYNMRLYDPSIKSIKDGRQKLDSVTVRTLETFTAMPASEKKRLSYGNQYEQVTKNYSNLIRKSKDTEVKKKLKASQRLGQIKVFSGKDVVTRKQYKKVTSLLVDLAVTSDEIQEYWGY